MAAWCAAALSWSAYQTPAMRSPDSQSSLRGCRPITVLHWAPTRSSAVMPTVQPLRAAWPTIWSVVWMALGRRMRGTASMSARLANSFMPMGVVRRRSSRFSRSTRSGQSKLLWSLAMTSGVALLMGVSPLAMPRY